VHKLRDRVERIQYMGNDATPVRAARVSFAKDTEMIWDEELQTFRLKKADKRLLNYLAGDGHWTPFGHTAITLRISMPLYIARQWFKHQIGFVYNEVSRRYVDDTPEFEFGIPWRHRPDASIKQGSGDVYWNWKTRKHN
jgi:thymidylate synthase (FAD)